MEGKRSNYIALAAALASLGALLVCSQAALESARAGLSLCAQMIVPSLLPFFMLSSLLQQLGLPGILGKLLSPVTQKLFGIGGAAAGRDGRVSARRGRRGAAAAQRCAHTRAGGACAGILQQFRSCVSRRRGGRGRVSQRGLWAAALRRARAVGRTRRDALRPAQRRVSAGAARTDRRRVARAGAAGGRAQRRVRSADGQRLCGHIQCRDRYARCLRAAARAGRHALCAARTGAALCARPVHRRARARHGHRRDAGADADAGAAYRCTARRRQCSPERISNAPGTRPGACCTE